MNSCPNAPERRKRRLSAMDRLRAKVIRKDVKYYSADDIEEIDDRSSLRAIMRHFTSLTNLYNDSERLYVQLMRLKVWCRLLSLRD